MSAPSAALRVTALNAAHRALGAKLVDFAGWEMPLAYGSQLEEHHRVRRDAGMFDVSHMLAIDVRGAGARDWLRGLLANDVARLRRGGKALYSCLLREDGGILDDLIAYFLQEDRYRLVVNAGTADKDLAWLESRRGAGVEIRPRRDLAIIAVQGPQAREKLFAAWPQARAVAGDLEYFQAALAGERMIARTGYTGEDGFEILLPAGDAEPLWNALLAQGVAPAGLGARDTLRLEAGMNLYGQDMDESVTPFEAGLDWTVALAPGRDFVGRRALESRPVSRQLLGLVLLGQGVMRARQQVRCAAGAGEVTSGGYSPTMGRSIALARLPRGAAAGDPAEVEMRGAWQPARVVKPPFVRHGRIRVSIEDGVPRTEN
jgi:aminomethyltransferase